MHSLYVEELKYKQELREKWLEKEQPKKVVTDENKLADLKKAMPERK